MYNLSLPYLRLLIGVIFVFLGLASTISFLSQGFSGLAFCIILAFCVGIEVTKILLGGDVGFYLAIKQPDKAIFSGVIVLVLVCLSLTAEIYFLMSGNLIEQAKLATATNRTATIQSQIDSAQANLDKCPTGYVTKCQKPLNTQIEHLQGELKTALASESEQAIAQGNTRFYEMLAKATGTTTDNLLLFINFIRALLGEVLGLYLCSQFATYRRLKNPDNHAFNHSPTDTLNAPVSDNSGYLAEIATLRAELAKKP